ncbi:AAA family ATPase [Roseivirga pacifica]|jgi:NadR type nicotinamide-nucleotide adenylyltransferase|uniref:AAA family ATPase n=1 Tax=Roseivirga pacifica TaxID=1267423 RepID=UPI0020953E9A|nr:ATP-binding protein [Roseivirga pacifica]MCO6359770.1 AAA family ATPase [Roseivirga pacifica]MCO6367140.1 AAA family ATPase [Roseivirga pacifica]MCO6370328.1 AAA family ATPase [Roseivirga pacifica]MCO6374797.1 AAA family ATPase [Roseivirga pacifica]MCO6380055.1 AAA family ATPase [Roseivirga pacifica]
MITVSIIGPESTGKTTLAKSLAAHYETVWVEEYAREYLDSISRPYTQSDLLEIASGQLKKQKEGRKNANKLLVQDTDLYVIKVWSEFKYGSCDPYILQQLDMQFVDLYFLTFFDVPYQDDPQRENRNERPELFDIYEKELKKSGVPYVVLQGDHSKRMKEAISTINNLL